MNSIFSKIISGELPAYKIYENKYVISFLSIDPYTKGHTIIAPKYEVDNFINVPEPYYTEMFSLAKKISIALEKSFKRKRIQLVIAGWEMPHAHIHLIPSDSILDLKKFTTLSFTESEMIEIQNTIIGNL